MDLQTYQTLRKHCAKEALSYGDIATIEDAFVLIPDVALRDEREHATAGDMLDEIGAYYNLEAS